MDDLLCSRPEREAGDSAHAARTHDDHRGAFFPGNLHDHCTRILGMADFALRADSHRLQRRLGLIERLPRRVGVMLGNVFARHAVHLPVVDRWLHVENHHFDVA